LIGKQFSRPATTAHPAAVATSPLR